MQHETEDIDGFRREAGRYAGRCGDWTYFHQLPKRPCPGTGLLAVTYTGWTTTRTRNPSLTGPAVRLSMEIVTKFHLILSLVVRVVELAAVDSFWILLPVQIQNPLADNWAYIRPALSMT